jgi:hypothetical protein
MGDRASSKGRGLCFWQVPAFRENFFQMSFYLDPLLRGEITRQPIACEFLVQIKDFKDSLHCRGKLYDSYCDRNN